MKIEQDESMSVPMLGLGTVQLGMPYGVTNDQGQVAIAEAEEILKLAREAGITLLDTAAAYGTSEDLLGDLSHLTGDARIVTKVPPIGASRITDADAQQVRSSCAHSLCSLRRSRVYGLLVHRAADLLSVGGERIWATLEQLRADRLVEKIGASVYTPDEIEQVCERFPVQLLQIPCNPFDQRLIHSGLLAHVARKGIEVHARSLFLQGVLLLTRQEIGRAPVHLHNSLQQWHQFLSREQLSPLAAALGFIRSVGSISVGLVGVTTRDELRAILSAWTSATSSHDYSALSITDTNVINPACWPA